MRATAALALVIIVVIWTACEGGRPPLEPDDVNPLLKLPDAGELD